jgi:membrane protein
MKAIFLLFKDSFTAWSNDKAVLFSAALAYYTIFSIAPLIIIAISIAGLVFGETVAQQEVFAEIERNIGAEAASALGDFIQNSSKPSGNIIAILIGLTVMLFGASLMFTQMKDALNVIWNVPPEVSGGLKGLALKRLIGFLMVLAIGGLLMVAITINTVISAVSRFINRMEGMPDISFIWEILNFAIFMGMLTLLFAIIFKVLPDVKIAWSDVWVGAAVTAVLFNLGKYLIVLYMTHSTVGSTYGAAGSLVVMLVWVYYSAQIFFFGAEFTEVYARRFGSQIVPVSKKTNEQEQGQDEANDVQSEAEA